MLEGSPRYNCEARFWTYGQKVINYRAALEALVKQSVLYVQACDILLFKCKVEII